MRPATILTFISFYIFWESSTGFPFGRRNSAAHPASDAAAAANHSLFPPDVDRKGASKDKEKRWSDFLAIDPSKVLSSLINKGGLLMPKSVQDELQTLACLLHVKNAKLDMIGKRFILEDFAVSLPEEPNALCIGRVFVKWDSYMKPCLDIEVDDVKVLFEFWNLFLTKSNWGALKDAGFPPTMAYETGASTVKQTSSSTSPSRTTSFVRFGSIDLSGDFILRIRSKPLNKDVVEEIHLSLDMFDNLNEKIYNISEANLAETGRRGCEIDIMYEVLQDFFLTMIRGFLASSAFDIVTNPFQDADTKTVEVAKKILSDSGKTLARYSGQAGKKKGGDFLKDVQDKLQLREDQIERLRSQLSPKLANLISSSTPSPSGWLGKFSKTFSDRYRELRKESDPSET